MDDEVLRIELRLHADSEEELERFAMGLQRDLEELPSTVAFAQAAAPEGAKSAGNMDWSQILLTLMASGGALTGLIGLIQARLSRERRVKLVIDGDELEVSGLDRVEQKKLIDAWLNRRKKHRGQRG